MNKQIDTKTIMTRYQAKKCLDKHKKLYVQLGSGHNAIDGWLNTDLKTKKNVYFLDATKKFPFDDNCVDAYFSEHMIEHLDYNQQKHMLNECYRTLKKNGILKINYPSLEALINAYISKDSDEKRDWIKWHCNRHNKQIKNDFKDDVPFSVIFNDFMRFWGHKFILDKELIEKMLHNAGFLNVAFIPLYSSSYDLFKNVENHQKNFYGIESDLNLVQTTSVEATK